MRGQVGSYPSFSDCLTLSRIVERGIRRLGDTGASALEYTPLLEEPTEEAATSSNDNTTTSRKSYGTTKSEDPWTLGGGPH